MKHLVAPVTFLIVSIASPVLADANSFSTMSVGSDAPSSCEAPRPPASLNRSAYIRNGYRAILRIMASERWQDTGSCECFETQISWHQVVMEAETYVISDNPLLPFKVADLRFKADEMFAARDRACSN